MHADCQLEFTGTLTHAPEVRTRMLDDNVSVPVVAFELELDNAAHSLFTAQQHYPIGGHSAAQAEAKRWHKGDRITVTSSLLDLRLVTRSACSVRAAPEALATAAPSLF